MSPSGKSGIVLVTVKYPVRVLPFDPTKEQEEVTRIERDPLVVRVWICPDRLTALALRKQWDDYRKPRPKEKQLKGFGEWCDSYWTGWLRSVQPRGASGVSPEFMFLRNNIVVEATTCTARCYQSKHLPPEGFWRGWPTERDNQEPEACLRAVEDWLKILSRPKRPTAPAPGLPQDSRP